MRISPFWGGETPANPLAQSELATYLDAIDRYDD